MDDLLKGVHKVLPKSPIDSNFIEWFIGLCEAESNFLIRTRKNEKGEVGGFEFVFRIALHFSSFISSYFKTTLSCF